MLHRGGLPYGASGGGGWREEGSMVRISVELPDEVAEALARAARENDMTVEALIAEVVTSYVVAYTDGDVLGPLSRPAPRHANQGDRGQVSS